MRLSIICVLIVLVAAGVREGYQRSVRSSQISASYAPASDGMVLVPAGDFQMGSSAPNAEADERPVRDVFLPAFDIYEVTNRQFKAFAPTHRFPDETVDWPATGIHKQQAVAYAAALGKRLPTAAEWEKAAGGTDGRRYPWGERFDNARCNSRAPGDPKRDLMPVGSFPDGVSPYGCHDMSGNAWEWVSDVHIEDSILDTRWKSRRGILKGGAHGYSPYQARIAYNGFEDERTTCNDVGFRCASDAEPE
ncbi:MAG: sulfatase modifying factor 1 [Rhodothermales bacterium]|jgi:sulfatase modifying factor 1